MTVRNNLNTSRSTNTASQTTYGTIADTTDTNLSTLAQVRDMAVGIVYQRKDAATRFDPITISNPTTWAAIFGLELGDRIKVEGTPMAIGTQSAQEQLVESTEFNMSDASAGTSPLPVHRYPRTSSGF